MAAAKILDFTEEQTVLNDDLFLKTNNFWLIYSCNVFRSAQKQRYINVKSINIFI